MPQVSSKNQRGQDLKVPLTCTIFQQYCSRLFILKHPHISPYHRAEHVTHTFSFSL